MSTDTLPLPRTGGLLHPVPMGTTDANANANTDITNATSVNNAPSTDTLGGTDQEQDQDLAQGGSTGSASNGGGLDLITTTTNTTTTTNNSTRSSPEATNSRLVALPRELLDAIASYLPTVDFNSLRGTCRHLESKIFPYWANCFFKKKQFMISEFSLQALLAISRHETLSRCLKHLIIGLDEFQAIMQEDLTNLEAFQQHHAAVCSQERLLDTGAAVDMLSEALANLPNLETIDIRDFNSPTRYRDPKSTWATVAEWRSYGSSEYRNWLSPRSRTYYSLLRSGTPIRNIFTVRVFKVVLVAAGKSSSCSVQGLEILLRNRYGALSDTAFALAPELNGRLSAVLRGLTRLHLDLRLDRVGIPPDIWKPSDPAVPFWVRAFYDPSTTNLRRFLAATPNVSWLRLNFVHDHLHSEPSVASRFLQWLALDLEDHPGDKDKPGWSDANPAPVAMPLRQLDLGDIQLGLDILTSLTTKFGGLEQINLKGISLPADADMAFAGASERRENSPWARYIRKLPAIAPNLKQLGLRRIQEAASAPSHASEVIFFLAAGEVPKTSEKATSQVLKNVDKAALDQLLDSMWTYRTWAEANNALTPEETDHEDSEASDDDSVIELTEVEDDEDAEEDI